MRPLQSCISCVAEWLPIIHHTGGQHFCGVHKQSMRTHAGDGKIFKTTSDIAVCCPKFGMALACPLPIAHIEDHCQEVSATPGMPRHEHAVYSERPVEGLGA
jgi:hypothetical protein